MSSKLDTWREHVEARIRQWSREIYSSNFTLDYPSKNILKSLQEHKGFAVKSSNQATYVNQDVWIIECIVSEIATYDPDAAAVLRIGYWVGGRWGFEKKRAMEIVLNRKLHKKEIFSLREQAVDEVSMYLKVLRDTTY